MPNYVYSNGFILGKTEDVCDFWEEIKDVENFIEHLLPLPQQDVSLPSTWGNTDAATFFWGCKWISIEEIDSIQQVFDLYSYIRFEATSAWCDFGPAIQKLSKKFPNLVFSLGSVEEQPSFAIAEAYFCGKLIAQVNTFFIPAITVDINEDENEYDYQWNHYWKKILNDTFDKAYELLIDDGFKVLPYATTFKVNYVQQESSPQITETSSVFEY